MPRITINGERWTLREVARLGPEESPLDGDCSRDARLIRVRKSLRGIERLETLIHEMIHAEGWHIDEEFVERAAADMAAVLWQLGYRGEK